MQLFIDTTERDEFTIALIDGDAAYMKRVPSDRRHAELLLRSIDELLVEQGVGKGHIDAVVAVPGPGSFTSLRIGITTANGLAYGLSVPLFSISKQDAIEHLKHPSSVLPRKSKHNVIVPEYGREPHITQKKRQ